MSWALLTCKKKKKTAGIKSVEGFFCFPQVPSYSLAVVWIYVDRQWCTRM